MTIFSQIILCISQYLQNGFWIPISFASMPLISSKSAKEKAFSLLSLPAPFTSSFSTYKLFYPTQPPNKHSKVVFWHIPSHSLSCPTPCPFPYSGREYVWCTVELPAQSWWRFFLIRRTVLLPSLAILDSFEGKRDLAQLFSNSTPNIYIIFPIYSSCSVFSSHSPGKLKASK